MFVRLIVAGFLVCVSVACGKGASPTTAPSPSAAAPTALALSPATDLITIRGTERFTIAATLSDGTTKVVQGTWGSDAPGIASAGADGTVTGTGSGEATVYADYQGLRASRRLRVVPNYNGRWSATYLTVSCAGTGDWAGDCLGPDDITRHTIGVVLQQAGIAMTGQLTPYSDIPTVPVTGAIDGTGHLALSGKVPYTIPDCQLDCLFEILSWDVVSSDSVNFSGQFTIRVSSPKLQGSRSWVSNVVATKPLADAATTGDSISRSFGPSLSPLRKR